MADLRQAAQQALEALTSRAGDSWTRRFARDRAIEALEAALAQQAEPVQFDPAEALRLADEYARCWIVTGSALQDHAQHIYDRKIDERDEARAALAAYLGIKEAK